MRALLVVVVVLVVILGGVLVLVNVAFDETKVRTHTVTEPVREIVVKSTGGDIDLVPAGRRIEVRETQHYSFVKPKLELDVKGGALTLDSSCSAAMLTCYADLRVTVPVGIAVTVETDSGEVDARGIDVRNAHARSDSGDVALELVGLQQLVSARTDSGDVDVTVADARAIEAESDSGDVTIDGGRDPRRIVARTNSGDVMVSAPVGEYAVDAHTDSGNVRTEGIALRDRAPKTIQARTDSGDVIVRAR